MSELEAEIRDLRRSNLDLLSEIERFKLKVAELESMILMLRRQIEDL